MTLSVIIINVAFYIRKQLVSLQKAVAVKNNNIDRHIVSLFVSGEKIENRIGRNTERLFFRIAVNSCRNHRKCDRFTTIFQSERQRISVTAFKQLFFAGIAAPPYRTYRVNYISARHFAAACDFGFTCPASAECEALFIKLRTCGTVYCAVHSSSAEQ